ncbi:MAG: hypothetical protein QOF14_796 [Hyphomicrobiales bacterium]|nr:hypothetical protein [Hyphomicrobiales bacterium]
MVKSRASNPSQSREQKNKAVERNWSNFLKMWHVCANTACCRARCCRGNPSACFTQNFSLLPEGVQDFFILLGEAQKEGLPFDEARAELTRVGLVAELSNWHDLAHGRDASSVVT